jgi:hypothetical protein
VASIAVGQTQQFTATGLYSDLSTADLTSSVTWTTSSGSTATISNAAGTQGLATGVANGAVTVTATDPSSSIPGTAALTVLPAVLVAITVNPPIATVAVGQTKQFTATGLYSDLSTADLTSSVTWSTSDGTTASISNASGSQGLATGVAVGAVTVTATDPSTSIPGTAALTVSPGTPVSAITMTPNTGHKRTHVAISGMGFTTGQTVTVSYVSGRTRKKLAKAVLCTTTVAQDGSFTCNGVIPRHKRAGVVGQKTVTASTPQGSTASTTFTLVKKRA